jgi:hypothetical protein
VRFTETNPVGYETQMKRNIETQKRLFPESRIPNPENGCNANVTVPNLATQMWRSGETQM